MLQDSNITGKFSRNHLPTISINFATGTKNQRHKMVILITLISRNYLISQKSTKIGN